MVDDVEHRRFDQLRLKERRLDADQRLVGEDHGALRHGIKLAREAEILEVIEEPLVKEVKRAEVVNILRVEMQVFDVIDHLLQARRDGKRAAAGVLAVEQIEHRDPVGDAGVDIAVHHGHLV